MLNMPPELRCNMKATPQVVSMILMVPATMQTRVQICQMRPDQCSATESLIRRGLYRDGDKMDLNISFIGYLT